MYNYFFSNLHIGVVLAQKATTYIDLAIVFCNTVIC